MAVLDHTLIYSFDLICPQRGTQTHLFQIPSCFLSVPGTGWNLCCLHPHMRVRAKQREIWDHCSFSGMKESSQAHLLCVRTYRAFHISLLSPKNVPVRAAACKRIFLWKLIAGIASPSSLPKPNSTKLSCLLRVTHKLLTGMGGVKITPKAEPILPARLGPKIQSMKSMYQDLWTAECLCSRCSQLLWDGSHTDTKATCLVQYIEQFFRRCVWFSHP